MSVELEEASIMALILTPVVIKVAIMPNVIITINNILRDNSVSLHINLRWNNGGMMNARVVVAKPINESCTLGWLTWQH